MGQRLKRIREICGLSTMEVAKGVGVSVSTYREWEYGRAIRGEPYQRLAKTLGVSLSELMTGESFSKYAVVKMASAIQLQLEELKKEIAKIE